MLRLLGIADEALPPDRLRVQQLAQGRAVFQAQAGVPEAADALAYEPTQRLLAVSGRRRTAGAGGGAAGAAARAALLARALERSPPTAATAAPPRQVGTADGRVKLLGADGVERCVFSASPAAGTAGAAGTAALLFVPHRGGVLRLDAVRAGQRRAMSPRTQRRARPASGGRPGIDRRPAPRRAAPPRAAQAGLLELFAVDAGAAAASHDDPGRPLAALRLDGDAVRCVAALPGEPLLLLGCESGAVRTAAVVNASGEPVAEARQARGLELLPYAIAPRKLDAEGAVQSLCVQCAAPHRHLLAVHAGSGAAVWDLRAQALVARVPAGKPAGSGPVTAAAWLHGSAKGAFATGHDGGDVNVWALPDGVATQQQQLQQPLLAAQLRVLACPPARGRKPARRHDAAQPRPPGRPVRALAHVPGRGEGLLVFGGGEPGQPDGLVLLPLPAPRLASGIEDPTTQDDQQAAAAAAALRLPWLGPVLGHALVPAQGSISGQDEPSAVLVLLEGGSVFCHDLAAYSAAAAASAVGDTAPAPGLPGASAAPGGAAEAPPAARRLQAQRSAGSPGGSPGGSPARLRGSGAALAQAAAGTGPDRAGAAPAAPPEPAPPVRLFAASLQGQPLVTAARLRIIPIDRLPLQGLQGACMASLHDWAAKAGGAGAADAGAADAAARRARSAVCGGAPAPSPSSGDGSDGGGGDGYGTLYCTGHADGGVRLWAMHGEAPQLLGAVPSAAARRALQARGAARGASVSTLEFAWEQGLLVSGHEGGEVRVYQFSEAPKRLECVLFESVGGRGDNDALPIQEPAGFQLRLVTRLHSCHIVCSAYLPQLKRVAVSDSSGSVSLIDLAAPSVPWFQAPWSSQPVVALALGHVPLPPAKDQHPAVAALLASSSQRAAGGRAGGAAPDPGCVHAVVAVAADSQVAVLDAATGFFLSKAGVLVPKHPSQALHVELLDASGAPTWASRDVRALVDTFRAQQHLRQQQARAQRRPAAAEAARQQAPGARERGGSGALVPSGGSGLGAAAGADGAGGDDGGSGPEDEAAEEDDESEDVDVDELLARAAAEVEARESAARAGSLRRGKSGTQPRDGRSRSRSASPVKRAGSAAAVAADADADAVDGPGRPARAGSGLRPPGGGGGGGSSASLAAQDAGAQAAGGSGGGGGGGGAPLVLSEPLACYVLVATRQFLRLYKASHAVAGDRTTARRVTLPGPLAFASAFSAAGAPALACLLDLGGEAHLQVYTLPGLEVVRGMPLSSLLGWAWRWDPRHAGGGAAPADALGGRSGSGALGVGASNGSARVLAQFISAPQVLPAGSLERAGSAPADGGGGDAFSWGHSRLAAVCAVTRHGHLALLGPGSELVRLGLAPGAAGAPASASVYDWELAAAAHAAAAALERRQLRAWAAAAASAKEARRRAAAGAAGAAAPGSPSCADAAGDAAPADDDAGEPAAGGGAEAEAGGGSGGGGGGAAKLKGLMTKLGGDLQRAGGGVVRGVQKALDETQRGLTKVAQAIESELIVKPGARQAAAVPEYPYPTLTALFAAPAVGDTSCPPVSSGGPGRAAAPAAGQPPAGGQPGAAGAAVARGAPSRAPASGKAAAAPAAGASGVYARPAAADDGAAPPPAAVAAGRASALRAAAGRAPGAATSAESAARAELLGGGAQAAARVGGPGRAAPSAGRLGSDGAATGPRLSPQQPGGLVSAAASAAAGGARVRTADEIRQAYGRAPQQKSAEVRGVLEETRAALAERGQRLGQLQDQTADLADSAAGFAELAKQLADKERGRGNWFG
ncbi:hypothetical protein HT031_003392 [Scenedesmus sp. PABB004]|nr:hypothetical protein HT031_003392 [Scenedesmus sp. PABB004]